MRRSAGMVLTILWILVPASGRSGEPLKLEIGAGGGVTMPTGSYAAATQSGFHVGLKVRTETKLPIDLVGAVVYSRFSFREGAGADHTFMLRAGPEIPIQLEVLAPYVTTGLVLSLRKPVEASTQVLTRLGVGGGFGIGFPLSSAASVDACIQYDVLNLVGKDVHEDTLSELLASIHVMFAL